MGTYRGGWGHAYLTTTHSVAPHLFLSCRYRFDFAVLLAEVVRHELSLSPLRRWFFVDTLAILDATKDEVGPCLRLQCLVRHYAAPKDLRAHRAARVTLSTHTHTY